MKARPFTSSCRHGYGPARKSEPIYWTSLGGSMVAVTVPSAAALLARIAVVTAPTTTEPTPALVYHFCYQA